jgi:hypothetical protein
MLKKFLRRVAAAGLPTGPGPDAVVTEGEIRALPETVQRYLRFMRVVGRPRDWSFRVSFEGRFRTRLDGPWLPCRVWQYNTRLELARIFHIRVRFGHVVPVLAWDTYVGGRGRMLGKAFGLITVVDGSGPEFDLSELVTYLNDAIFLAPTMVLGPEAVWSAVDAGAFDVALSDGGLTVSARVFVDERGAPVDFSTTDRFYPDTGTKNAPLVRGRWTTPFELSYVDGRPVAATGRAVWHLPDGPKPYADFTLVPGTLAYNVAPGE